MREASLRRRVTEFFQYLEKQNVYLPNLGKYVAFFVDAPAGKIGIQQDGSTNGVGSVTRSYIHKYHLGCIHP
jgi:hypothetical protein